jgi:4-hydroxy-2-oxoglutarate aldolase
LFKGAFAPIPTPFLDGEIAFDKLAENLERWVATDLAGIVVLGSNGEFALLARQEKEALIAAVCEKVAGRKQVLAGTGCESTAETIALTQRAGALGADGALVVTPHYYKGAMTDSALKAYFTAVADAAPIPVLLYNMPRNTGINMSSDLVLELANHPNIVGIKDSSGNVVQMAEIVNGAPEGFAVFAGSGSFLLPSLAVGAVGGTMAVANVLPNECARIITLFETGQMAEARALQLKILALNRAVTVGWGVAGLKAALDLRGFFGGDPRPPLLPLGAVARKELAVLLEKF